MVIIVQCKRVDRWINTQTLRHCYCCKRLLMIILLPICKLLLVNLFAYVIFAQLNVCLWDAINIDLELLLLGWYLIALFLLLIKLFQMLLSLTIFCIRISNNRFLLLIIVKVEIIKAWRLFLNNCWAFSKCW